MHYNRLIFQGIFLINFAGMPPTTLFASTSFVTTAPAATTEFLPIVTPGSIVTLEPNQTRFSRCIGAGIRFFRI